LDRFWGQYLRDLATKCGPKGPRLRRGVPFWAKIFGQFPTAWSPKPIQKGPLEEFKLHKADSSVPGGRLYESLGTNTRAPEPEQSKF